MKTMWKCSKCGDSDYLVLSISARDEVCESCGTWQDAEYNEAWERIS